MCVVILIFYLQQTLKLTFEVQLLDLMPNMNLQCDDFFYKNAIFFFYLTVLA